MISLTQIVAAVDRLAPASLAEPWDNVGLQVGDPAAEVRRVLTAVEASPAVIEETVAVEGTVLVCHHPLILQPLPRLVCDDPTVRSALRLHDGRAGLVVAHTNLDNSAHGPSAVLAEQLGLVEPQPFPVSARERRLKLVVFVPEEALTTVRDALAAAGAGVIGNYSHCSFRSAGTGTFVPLEGATPYTGTVGRPEEVAEYRLEMVVSEPALPAVVTALKRAHPYDEVAHDVYALEGAGDARGFGRLGELASATRLDALAQTVSQLLAPACLRLVGPPGKMIRRVAAIAGSGGDHLATAADAGAEAVLTGDVKHHQAAQAEALGLCVLDAGHHETERSAAETLSAHLRVTFGEAVSVELAAADRSPFRSL